MFKKVLFGISVLILGVLLLFNNMDFFTLDIDKIWPIIILVFGIAEILDVKKLNITSAILLVIGTYFILYNYGIINVALIKVLIPIILIMVGLSLLFPIKIGKELVENTENDLTLTSIFSDVSNKSKSKKFHKATINTIFGGATLDLREVVPENKKCVCISTVIFGGLDIILSDDWEINSDGLTCIFGGVENNRKVKNEKKDQSKQRKILYLTGTILFGGIEIK